MPKICKNIRNRHFNLSSFRSLFFPTSLHKLNAMRGPAWHCKRFNRQSRTAKPTHLNISQITQGILKPTWGTGSGVKRQNNYKLSRARSPFNRWSLVQNGIYPRILAAAVVYVFHHRTISRNHTDITWWIGPFFGKSWIACRHENWNEYLDIFVSSA